MQADIDPKNYEVLEARIFNPEEKSGSQMSCTAEHGGQMRQAIKMNFIQQL